MKRLLSHIRPVQFFLSCLSLSMLFANACEPAAAQQRGPVQRIVQGKVETKANVVIANAVVYLKDTHTLAVKSAFSDATGDYRFGQLSPNSDYEVWAESNGKKSSTHSISSLDTRSQFDMNLKIDTGK